MADTTPESHELDGMPLCVRYVDEKADELRAVMFARCADLDTEPAADDDVQRRSDGVFDWLEKLGTAYEALATCFLEDSQPFLGPAQYFGSLPAGLGEWPGERLRWAKQSGEKQNGPSWISNPLHDPMRAPYVIETEAMGWEFPDRKAELDDRHPATAWLNVDEWQDVACILRDLRRWGVSRAATLLDWIGERRAVFVESIAPRVEITGKKRRRRTVARLRYAGSEREVELTGKMLEALDDLRENGRAKLTRHAKADLLREVPELAPWLEPGSREGIDRADTEHTTIAALPALRRRIILP